MIQINDLHFAYKRKPVFDGLSLQFQAGSIYGLLGKNGTGKSTLLRSISGLLFPDKGAIDVLGFNPAKRQPGFLKEIFLIAEEFYLPDVSIKKFIRCNAPFYPNYNDAQFETYLKEFDIPIEHSLQQMSYGQKKKVLISFALACNTSLLLMDEPTNGLDIMSKSQFRKVIAGAIDEHKCIIISTHQVKDLEALIDHITIIDEGKILFSHSIDEIMNRLTFTFSFDKDEIGQALFAEPTLSGQAIVLPNRSNESEKIDLELLYKAVVTNGVKLNTLFENELINLKYD